MGCEKGGDLYLVASNPLQELEITRYTPLEVVPSVPSDSAPFTRYTADSPRERVSSDFPVAATDLMPLDTNAPISDTDIERTSESQNETAQGRPPLRGR